MCARPCCVRLNRLDLEAEKRRTGTAFSFQAAPSGVAPGQGPRGERERKATTTGNKKNSRIALRSSF
jgi:hypothetical protein